MNARRLTSALLVALTISGLFTFWLSRRVASSRNVAHATLKYVAALKSMESGEVLKAGSVQLVEWPDTVQIQGAHTRLEDVIGRNVLYPLAQGEPILDRDLAAVGSGAGLTAKIPQGMRATSLKSDEVVGVAGFLLPGTHVDVLETNRMNNVGNSVTTTVLQDVEVLAAGQKIEPDPEGKPSSVNVVTLLLKPEDAEKAVLASAEGSIHFVLRNGSDHARIASSGAGMIVSAAVAKPSKPAGRVPASYAVETMLGDKKVVSNF